MKFLDQSEFNWRMKKLNHYNTMERVELGLVTNQIIVASYRQLNFPFARCVGMDPVVSSLTSWTRIIKINVVKLFFTTIPNWKLRKWACPLLSQKKQVLTRKLTEKNAALRNVVPLQLDVRVVHLMLPQHLHVEVLPFCKFIWIHRRHWTAHAKNDTRKSVEYLVNHNRHLRGCKSEREKPLNEFGRFIPGRTFHRSPSVTVSKKRAVLLQDQLLWNCNHSLPVTVLCQPVCGIFTGIMKWFMFSLVKLVVWPHSSLGYY